MGGRRTSILRGAPRAAALTVGMALLSFAAYSASLTVSETGSTLILPLFKAWVTAYEKVDPDLQMTVGATGSEAGIAQAIANQVQIGTSDAYMSDTEAMAHPHILNIPLAISAQTVVANLPELRGATLKLSGPVLASIYAGAIREWDEPRIAAINQGVPLPHHAIVPIRRADGSGDTFVFSQFLTFSTPDQQHLSLKDFNWEGKIGYGTTVSWPSVAGSLSASGNQGMVETLAEHAVFRGLSWRELPGRCGQGRSTNRDAGKPGWKVFASDPGNGYRCRCRTHPPHAARRASYAGVRPGAGFVSAYQLRIRSCLGQTTEPADGGRYQQLSPLVHWTAGRQCTELPRTGAFYCVAETHPCSE